MFLEKMVERRVNHHVCTDLGCFKLKRKKVIAIMSSLMSLVVKWSDRGVHVRKAIGFGHVEMDPRRQASNPAMESRIRNNSLRIQTWRAGSATTTTKSNQGGRIHVRCRRSGRWGYFTRWKWLIHTHEKLYMHQQPANLTKENFVHVGSHQKSCRGGSNQWWQQQTSSVEDRIRVVSCQNWTWRVESTTTVRAESGYWVSDLR